MTYKYRTPLRWAKKIERLKEKRQVIDDGYLKLSLKIHSLENQKRKKIDRSLRVTEEIETIQNLIDDFPYKNDIAVIKDLKEADNFLK